MKRHLAALAVVPLALISSALLLFGGIPKTLAADAALRIGPGGRVTFPHHPIMHTGTRVTVEFWVKTEPSSGGIDWLRNAGPQEHKQVVAYADGSINYLYTGSPWHQYPQYGGVTLPGPGTIPIDSQWHHLAFVRRDNGTWSFYVDGTRIVNEGPGTGLGNGCWLTCDIREGSPATELRCLSDALSSFAIDSLRVSKVARYDQDFVPARSWVSDTETAMLLNFDEGSGYTVQDQGPGQQIGTISSGTWVKGLSVTNAAPTVIIKSATMRGATGLMDVVFRVNDPDDATVKTRALAFIDGQRSFAKVIKPTTFAEGTESKLGDAIASNTDHTLTWNVAADWNISLGQIKFEILAMDTRGLLPLDWVTIPAANGQPELTISKNAPTDQETLDALFWQYASGDPGLKVEQGLLRGSEDIGVLSGSSLVAGSSICSPGVVYALKTMNLSPAGTAEITRSVAARAIKWDTERWHAVKEPYQDFGRLVAWGRNDASQTNAPEGLGPATKAISAGEDHNLVLMKDGTVTAWGGNAYGQCSIPENLSNVSAIAAGFFSSFAVKADGTVVGWGYDYYNQLKIPAGLSGVKAISASSHCLALKTNGTVVGWGSNHSGQAIVPSSLSDVVAVATGDGHSLALKADGTVVSWGYNASGQTDVPAGLTGVVKIAAAGSHSIAVKANGTVVAWGYNLDGATDVPEGLSDVIDVAAGNSFNIALKADGSMVAWGYNQFGQTIIPQNVFPVVAVSGRGAHVLAVSLRDAP